MPNRNVKNYTIGVKYKVGARVITTSGVITKNIRVAPTRAIRAALARQVAADAARARRTAATSTGFILVSGAGTTQVNGTYHPFGTLNGQTRYLLGSDPLVDPIIAFNGSTWNIGAGAFTVYSGGATLGAAFTTGGGAIGDSPAPTVAFTNSGSAAHVLAVNVTTPMLASQLRLLSVKRGKYKFTASNP